MKNILLSCILAGLLTTTVYAEENTSVMGLMKEWAKINYLVAEDDQEKAFAALAKKAHDFVVANPKQADALIWNAIIKSTYAGAKGGLGALSLMEEARDLLLIAEKIDPQALGGAVYTTLGSFYYMVPGWPIGFGDDDTALEYLQKGLAIAPDNMDANYFMGDYWMEDHNYKKAAPFLEKVISLPDVKGRPVYSKGRKAEAAKRLAKIKH